MKLLNSVKLGFAGKERLIEEGGHRHGPKKRLNSVRLQRQQDRARRTQLSPEAR